MRVFGVVALTFAVCADSPVQAAPPSNPEPDPDDGATPDDPYDGKPVPRDPNETPFMRAPNNQVGNWQSPSRRSEVTRGFSSRRKFQLTVLPVYASFRLPLRSREDQLPLRGVGAALEFDIQLVRWLSLRITASHTVHPVEEVKTVDEESEEVSTRANEGMYQASNAGVGVVYPIDLGRFVPLVDFGVGGIFMQAPQAAVNGQQGGQCRDDGTCDFGLACSAANVCEPTIVPELHIGAGMDVLLGDHWAIGLHVRYFALLSDPANFPVYLQGAIRLAARF